MTDSPNQANPARNAKFQFRCADVGPKDCTWQTSGNSEQEILSKVEQHGQEKHNMKLDENTRTQVRNSIRRQAA